MSSPFFSRSLLALLLLFCIASLGLLFSGAERVLGLSQDPFQVDDLVEVEWEGDWYLAQILELDADQYYITYIAYDSSWDEWVGSSRIKAIDWVQVEWQGDWYLAEILEQDAEQYYITYIGYDSSWDEWVTDSSVQSLEGEAQFPADTQLELQMDGSWYLADVHVILDDYYYITYDANNITMIGWVHSSQTRDLDYQEFTDSTWVSAFYVAYWNRAGDPDGMDYWTGLIEGETLDATGVAENFAFQSEAMQAYPYFADPGSATQQQRQDFIHSVYENLLNISPEADDDGVLYWVEELTLGRTSPGAVIGHIIHAAMQENSTNWQTIWNKIQVAEYYTQSFRDTSQAWTAEEHKSQAMQVMQDISSEQSTVDLGKDRVQRMIDGSYGLPVLRNGQDTQVDGLLFYIQDEDAGSIYYFGSPAEMDITHLVLQDQAGQFQALIAFSPELYPIQWIFPELTVSVPIAEGTELDPAQAVHIFLEEEEALATMDIELDMPVQQLLDQLPQELGLELAEPAELIQTRLQDLGWLELSAQEAIQQAQTEQELSMATMLSIAGTALRLQEQLQDIAEQESESANYAQAPGFSNSSTYQSSFDWDIDWDTVKNQLTSRYATKLLEKLKVPQAGTLVSMLDYLNRLASGHYDGLDIEGPAVSMLLCKGASSIPKVCHEFYMPNIPGNATRCTSLCFATLDCFVDICQPMMFSVEDARNLLCY